MAPSDFAKANIDEIIDNLTTEEAILLTAGVGFWHTHAVERLGVPAVKVSDGPNGIRGNHFFMGTPAKCLPSATALGATWDTKLVEEVGLKLLAAEAKLRAASVVLAPTCNIQRSPLGGRSFESFSEDPLLSGLLAAAYVRGTQNGGVGTTIKHFVGNDKENDRMAYDSIISARALREIYLMPFMLAQKYAQPWSIMTAYNRVNGTHVSENPALINDILRKEWGFEGLVMSDWFGVYSVDHSIKAGLDLEMPGINKWRSVDLMNRSIQSRKITIRDIRARARKVLELVQKCAQGAPEILDGDGQERTVESEEDKALMRKVAAESIVLLKNEGAILPLNSQKVTKVAIVGGNAKANVLSGGGSAALKSSYFVSPYDGIVNALAGSNVEVTYSEGARAYMTMPTLENELVTSSGERGWIGSWHSHESDDSLTPVENVLETRHIDETRMFISTSVPKNITKRWSLRLRGTLKPRPYDCAFEFGLTAAGRAKGSSITLPWVDKVPALVHAWYLGNATGDAIADVLFGKHNPSGKLSLTFPKRLEDVPSYGHFHSENGEVRYGEDLFVGYKHYQHRNIEPLFPFGFGLSYTTFTLSDLKLSAPVVADKEFSLTASVTVTNTGSVAGSEIVQLYVSPPATSDLTHAALQLRAFAKVRDLQPGASERVELALDKYAVSYWEERFKTWAVEKGVYGVKVGASSDALILNETFVLSKGFEWTGI
ncbi:hypothetical protein H0H87_006027 [Tephrocybe sp. NHM501043]|nr:hypothetical protein H0H87_006027 [Tephrocybe sp. NHM501043]